MDRLALIFGQHSVAANRVAPYDLTDAMRATGASIYTTLCDVAPAMRQATERTLDDLAAKDKGEVSMVFAIANGRDLFGQKAAQLYGGSSDLEDMLKRLTNKAQNRGAPLDIFMLTAGDTGFIHQYAQRLPPGSAVVAAATWPDSDKNLNLWQMLCRPALHADVPLTSRSLLLHLLLGANETKGLPEIAVSGKPQATVKDMWKEMIQQGGISHAARQELGLIATHMDAKYCLEYEATRDMIDRQGSQVAPLGNSFYACAVASTWDNFFGARPVAQPSASVAAATAGASVARKASVAQGDTAPAPLPDSPAGRKPRLTNGQVAGMWKMGKKPWQQSPVVVKRLLRRN